jgi:hypothetical protein
MHEHREDSRAEVEEMLTVEQRIEMAQRRGKHKGPPRGRMPR